MTKLRDFGHSLYDGSVSIDFVGRRWLWYSVSGVILLAAIGGLVFRGLNLGIEFEGGVEYQVSMARGQATEATVEKIRNAVAQESSDADIPAAGSPIVNASGSN